MLHSKGAKGNQITEAAASLVSRSVLNWKQEKLCLLGETAILLFQPCIVHAGRWKPFPIGLYVM